MEKTTTRESFAESIGKFMHNCGAIEFVVNGAITELATDTTLLDSVLRGPLNRRIDLLAALLRERTQLNPNTIDELRRDLHRIREVRNKVAHNPIIALDKSSPDSERIVVFRGAGNRETREELTQGDVVLLAASSGILAERLSNLISECRESGS